MPTPSALPGSSDALLQKNINDLARIIASEAGGESEAAQIMVGWTVVNRMKQTGIKAVSSIPFGQYAHGSMPSLNSLNSLRIAKGIFEGTIRDNSQGATNFYTPSRMPIEGDTKPHIDIRGGLESVPGVTRNGRAVRNYFPGWVHRFSRVLTPQIPEKTFKFYRGHRCQPSAETAPAVSA